MKHVVIFVEGMNLSSVAGTLTPQYEAMWAKMASHNPALGAISFRPGQDGLQRDDDLMMVQWGHPLPTDTGALRPDQLVMAAENTLHSRISYQKIQESAGEHRWKPNLLASILESPIKSALNLVVEMIKDEIFTLGMTDVLYYTAQDGERAVRTHVYEQALNKLDSYAAESGELPPIALHLITHSQGATIGFDFLFGLFAPSTQWPQGQPDFATDPSVPKPLRDRYLAWRQRARSGQLVLGSFSTFGSQLALMMMRTQKLVKRLADDEYLDPTVIGIPQSAIRPFWKNFYDRNDVLGYPVRPLFQPADGIDEFEVNSSLNPMDAHTAYLENTQVQTEISAMIESAMR